MAHGQIQPHALTGGQVVHSGRQTSVPDEARQVPVDARTSVTGKHCSPLLHSAFELHSWSPMPRSGAHERRMSNQKRRTVLGDLAGGAAARR